MKTHYVMSPGAACQCQPLHAILSTHNTSVVPLPDYTALTPPPPPPALQVRPDALTPVVRVADFYGTGASAASTSRLSLSIAAADGTGAAEVFASSLASGTGGAAGGAAAAARVASAPGSPVWAPATWCHVALVITSSGAASLFLGGASVPVSAAGATSAPLAALAVQPRMGFLGRGPLTGAAEGEQWFAGAISDVQFYSAALGASLIYGLLVGTTGAPLAGFLCTSERCLEAICSSFS